MLSYYRGANVVYPMVLGGRTLRQFVAYVESKGTVYGDYVILGRGYRTEERAREDAIDKLKKWPQHMRNLLLDELKVISVNQASLRGIVPRGKTLEDLEESRDGSRYLVRR